MNRIMKIRIVFVTKYPDVVSMIYGDSPSMKLVTEVGYKEIE